jgi:hypothetical protein
LNTRKGLVLRGTRNNAVGVLSLGVLLAACQPTSVPEGAEAADPAAVVPEGVEPAGPAAIAAPAVAEPANPVAIAAQSRVEQVRAIVPDGVTIVEIVEVEGTSYLRITGRTASNRSLARLLCALDDLGLGFYDLEVPSSDEVGFGEFAITVRSR